MLLFQMGKTVVRYGLFPLNEIKVLTSKLSVNKKTGRLTGIVKDLEIQDEPPKKKRYFSFKILQFNGF